MVDIHSHILPGLDDGARSIEEAVNMARIAVDSGIYHMAATSHGNYYPYSIEQYMDSFGFLQETLAEQGIPLKLYSGMEIFVDDRAIKLLKGRKLLTLNNTDYILIEFDFEERVSNVLRWIHKIQNMGYRIVLAHPERYIFIQNDLELAFFLEETGCVLQVNGGSLLGNFGKDCQYIAGKLMRNGIVGVLATDAHDTRYRFPDLRVLWGFMSHNESSVTAKLLLSENPSRILKGYEVLRREHDKGKEE